MIVHAHITRGKRSHDFGKFLRVGKYAGGGSERGGKQEPPPINLCKTTLLPSIIMSQPCIIILDPWASAGAAGAASKAGVAPSGWWGAAAVAAARESDGGGRLKKPRASSGLLLSWFIYACPYGLHVVEVSRLLTARGLVAAFVLLRMCCCVQLLLQCFISSSVSGTTAEVIGTSAKEEKLIPLGASPVGMVATTFLAEMSTTLTVLSYMLVI